jgi:hypothetical protein
LTACGFPPARNRIQGVIFCEPVGSRVYFLCSTTASMFQTISILSR